MKNIKLVYFIFIGIISCQNSNNVSEADTKKDSITKVSVLSTLCDTCFTCYPDTINKDDTITIELPKNHPKGLAIQFGKEFFYLADPIEEPESSTFFKNINGKYIVKIPANVNGTFYEEGDNKLKPVFVKRGAYKIIFSDNFETEWENEFFLSCNVYFKN